MRPDLEKPDISVMSDEAYKEYLSRVLFEAVERAKRANHVELHLQGGSCSAVVMPARHFPWIVVGRELLAEWVEKVGLRLQVIPLKNRKPWWCRWYHEFWFGRPYDYLYEIRGWKTHGPPLPEGPLARPFMVFGS